MLAKPPPIGVDIGMYLAHQLLTDHPPFAQPALLRLHFLVAGHAAFHPGRTAHRDSGRRRMTLHPLRQHIVFECPAVGIQVNPDQNAAERHGQEAEAGPGEADIDRPPRQ